MRNLDKIWVYGLFFVFCFASCSDMPLDEKKQSSALVFERPVLGKDGRTVDQNRYHIHEATNSVLDDISRQRNFNLAMASRATAVIGALVFTRAPNDADQCVNAEAVSSAVLVSDFHAVTAAHFTRSIAGELPIVWVGFDGLYSMDSMFNDFQGYWAPDAASVPSPFSNSYDPAWEETMNYRWDQPEETPFLPNRLIQLGLDDWAAGNADASMFRKLLHRRLRARAHHPFSSLEERDIAFLTFAKDQWTPLEVRMTDLGFTMPASIGAFSLRSPAPFFNHVRTPSPDSDIHYELSPKVEMWGLITNQWPGEAIGEEDTYYSTLVAREAYAEPTWTSVVELLDCDSSGQPFTDEHLVMLSSMDSLKGASGGGYYACDHQECAVYMGDGEWKEQSESDLLAPLMLTKGDRLNGYHRG